MERSVFAFWGAGSRFLLLGAAVLATQRRGYLSHGTEVAVLDAEFGAETMAPDPKMHNPLGDAADFDAPAAASAQRSFPCARRVVFRHQQSQGIGHHAHFGG
jgi:hypothetical protein